MRTRRTRLWVGAVGWLAVLGLGGAGWLRSRGPREPSIPIFAPVADFELTDQDGAPFGTASLRGKVWIVGFAFTECTTVCPMLTSQMANLERRLARHGDDVHLVTITVDPENDTPARLRAYAERHHADLGRWSFLTGAPAQVRDTITRAFLVHVGPRQAVQGGVDILHTARLSLVDREGRLRGTYATDADGLTSLERDVGALVAR